MGAEHTETDHSSDEHELTAWLAQSNRFRIVGKLGAGGMGAVYHALDLERGGHVALKTLHTTNAQTLYRFKQEFRALTEIVHPRLIRLYELFADGDHWFFTMELIDGGVNLLDHLRSPESERHAQQTFARADTLPSRPPPPPESSAAPTRVAVARARVAREAEALATVASAATPVSARITLSYPRVRAAFAQLAEGVHALHEAGRLHRDLKPENVFVRRDGEQVVLLDFGLVAALESSGHTRASVPDALPSDEPAQGDSSEHSSLAYHATQAGLIAGTVEYMAPEQGMAHDLTPAADWYALGVMLYEVLTGELPYQGSNAQILMRKQLADPAPPARVVPDTPDDLSDLCMALMRRPPAERPLGAEVVARLGGLAHGEDTSRSVFVGRAHALATLQEAYRASRTELTVVSVHGRSGAGKSTLLARFFGELSAQPDTLVLTGRCYEQEFIPFKAVDSLMDALTRYLLHLPRPELERILPPDARALARVFPVLGRLYARPPRDADAGDPQAVRRRAFAAMRSLLQNLARHARLVLYIDDLQWGDADSAALLAEVLRPPDAPPLLVVLSYRSEEAHNAGLRAIGDACRGSCRREHVYDLDVGALAPDDAHALAERLVGVTPGPWATSWVLEQARGSAFLIHELARYLHAGGAPTGVEGLSLDDILWERVRALPEASQALLGVVAVAGRPVRQRHAQRAARLDTLAPGVTAGLGFARLLRTEGTGSDTELVAFHDRVRESIVARTEPHKLAQYALALANALEDARDGDAETLAALYERAGQRGRASRHYAAAVGSAVAALAFEHAETLAARAVALAESDEERALAYEAAVHFHSDMGRYEEAYALTRAGAAALGMALPERFVPPLLVADLLAVQARLIGRPTHALLSLPTMPAGRMQLAVRLANAGAKAAFQVRPELCVAVCTKIVRLCLAHGNTPDCAVAYMVFGAIFQGGILGRYTTGYELGQLALALVDKYQNERQRAEVSFVVGYFGMSWLKPASAAEALWRTAFDAGRRSGDLFHMGCAAAGRVMSLTMRGVPLDELGRECDTLEQPLARNGLREQLAVVRCVRQFARDLRGETAAHGSWADSAYDERAEASAWPDFGASHFGHFCMLARAQSYYLWDRVDDAERTLRAAQAIAAESKGMLHSAEHVFIAALVAARSTGMSGARRHLTVMNAARKLRSWARRCPDNFAAKAELVWAEALRIGGREHAARRAYARAARLARVHGHVHVEGMAHRLAAHGGASGAHEAAREAFTRWGAHALAARDPGGRNQNSRA